MTRGVWSVPEANLGSWTFLARNVEVSGIGTASHTHMLTHTDTHTHTHAQMQTRDLQCSFTVATDA